jgi:hypothetical protein
MRADEFVPDAIWANLKSGGLDVDLSTHVKDRMKEHRIPNRVLNLGLTKLKKIKAEMAKFEPGYSFWALDPTTQLSLGVRKMSGTDRYLVATAHYRRTYDTEDRPVIAMPRGDAITSEDLLELDFMGSECTKDCSGHRAGYAWSVRKGRVPAQSWSPSFNKGAALAWSGK